MNTTSADPMRSAQDLQGWAQLCAPELIATLPDAVIEAERIVAHKLSASLLLEGLASPELSINNHIDAGFARAIVSDVSSTSGTIDTTDQLLNSQPVLRNETKYREDVTNAVLQLALTLARQRTAQPLATLSLSDPKLLEHCRRLDPIEAHMALDQVNALGGNVHPLSRLRSDFTPADAQRYTAECLPSHPVMLRFVAVRKRLLQRTTVAGPHLDQILMAEFADLAAAHENLPTASEYSLVPVHPWQLEHVIPESYRQEIASGDMVPLDIEIPTTPSTSPRTLVCGAGASGSRWAVKTAISVRLTSTRRDISPATTVNGPAISRVVSRIAATDPWLKQRIGIFIEVAGTAFRPPTKEVDPTRARGLSAVLREDYSRLITPGVVAITGSSLTAGPPSSGPSLLARAIDTLARRRGLTAETAARRFLQRYADLFASSTIVLLTKYGVGFEGHLQNTVLVLNADCEPIRVLLRDFGGVRIHRPRLLRAGYRLQAHPDSITIEDAIAPVRRKAYYTCLQANLAELVLWLANDYRLDPTDCWSVILRELERGFRYVAGSCRQAAEQDRAALREPYLQQKAFVRMGLDLAGGDRYVAVPNPLAATDTPTHKIPTL